MVFTPTPSVTDVFILPSMESFHENENFFNGIVGTEDVYVMQGTETIENNTECSHTFVINFRVRLRIYSLCFLGLQVEI